LRERAGFGGTPEAIAHLVYYQQVPNVTFPPCDASGLFPADDFGPPADVGEPIRQAARTGQALGITVERPPGTMWLQPVVDAGFFDRLATNGEMVRVARWCGPRMLTTEHPPSQEAARACTGWGLAPNQFVQRTTRHENEAKTVFGRTGPCDGEPIIALLLAHPACAPFLGRTLYRFFGREAIAPTLAAQLAARLRAPHDAIAPLLETLLLSRDFDSAASVATQSQSPVPLVIATYTKLGVQTIPGTPRFGGTAALGQPLGAPPHVAGWPGGRRWLTPSTLLPRQNCARDTLFPQELPPPARQPLACVAPIIGHEPYQQVREMAQRGAVTSAPAMVMAESGLNRRPGMHTETSKILRGMYHGAGHRVAGLKGDPPTPAPIDLTGMVRQAGVSTDAETVDDLAHRFLRTPRQSGDRHDLIQFLTQRLGGSVLDCRRADLETALRALRHLILSVPASQLA
jgi:hypothetical protein